MADIMELTRFRLVPGADIGPAASKLDAWLAARDGFVSRALVGPDGDGVFTDVVRWRDLDSAHAAMEEIAAFPEAAAFMAAIDPSSVQMGHGPVVHES